MRTATRNQIGPDPANAWGDRFGADRRSASRAGHGVGRRLAALFFAGDHQRCGPRLEIRSDRTLQTLGAIALEQTDDRRRVPDTALAVVLRLFSSLVIINDADRDSKSDRTGPCKRLGRSLWSRPTIGVACRTRRWPSSCGSFLRW